jgi:hypothetical protein
MCVAVAVAACGANDGRGRPLSVTVAPSASAASPIASAAPSAIAVAPSASAAPAPPPSPSTPFAKAAPITFTPRKDRVAMRPLAAATSAPFSPDGVTYFIDASLPTGARGGYLVAPAKRTFFPVGEVHDARWSSDGAYLAILDDEHGRVTVIDVRAHTTAREIRGVGLVRWLSATVVVYWTGCRVMQVDLTRQDPPVAIGAESCGGADASDDGSVFAVISPSRHPRFLAMRPYTKLVKIDGHAGAASDVATPPGGFTDPTMSPDGRRVCFNGGSSKDHTLAGFGCADLVSLTTVVVDGSGDGYSAGFDVEGNQMAYRVGDTKRLADFRTWTTRDIGDFGDMRYQEFFPGGRRFIGYANSSPSRVYDLDGGWSIEILPASAQPQGFFAVPGSRNKRFVHGRAAGANRALYVFELPD